MERNEIETTFAEALAEARAAFPSSMLLRLARLKLNQRFTRCLGRATFGAGARRGLVELSASAFLHSDADPEECDDTIRHELAHLVAFELYADRGHGDGFKRAARALGARPKSRAPRGSFQYLATKQRRTWRRLTCSECGRLWAVSAVTLGKANSLGRAFSCECGSRAALVEDAERLTKGELGAEIAEQKAERERTRALAESDAATEAWVQNPTPFRLQRAERFEALALKADEALCAARERLQKEKAKAAQA
jgi:predicted SprT family Zn-dependent metalloprotease